MRTAICLAAFQDNEILLVRKKASWILPGGKPEIGEKEMECLKREIREELNANAVIFGFYGSFIGITPHKRDMLEARVYFGELIGEINPSMEISEAKFVDNPYEYNLSDITRKIMDSLKKDLYLK